MELVKELNKRFGIYREPVTDVLYLFRWVEESCGLTVMLDPETNRPLTWKRYQEIENEKNAVD